MSLALSFPTLFVSLCLYNYICVTLSLYLHLFHSSSDSLGLSNYICVTLIVYIDFTLSLFHFGLAISLWFCCSHILTHWMGSPQGAVAAASDCRPHIVQARREQTSRGGSCLVMGAQKGQSALWGTSVRDVGRSGLDSGA